MKFKNFKILISIIALINFTFSSSLENKSRTNSLNSNQSKSQSQNKMTLNNSNKSTNKNKSTSSTTTLSLSKLLKRSSFYSLNGVAPPHAQMHIDDQEAYHRRQGEMPKEINKPIVTDPHSEFGKNTKILEDWLMISSEAFKDKSRFPDIYLHDQDRSIKIKIDNMKFRINDAHNRTEVQENNPHDKNCFWFRLSGLNIYYSSTKTDYNILGAVQIAEIIGVISLEGDHTGYECFIVKDNYDTEWKICSASKEKRNLWVCTIEETIGTEKKDTFCSGGMKDDLVVYHDVIYFYIYLTIYYFKFFCLFFN